MSTSARKIVGPQAAVTQKGSVMQEKADIVSHAGMRNFYVVALLATAMWAALIWGGLALL